MTAEIEPRTSRFGVRRSTTTPPRSLKLNFNLISQTVLGIIFFQSKLRWERGGVVVEHRAQNRKVQGSIPTGVTVLCP